MVVANFTPQSHSNYRVSVSLAGFYEEIFNTDAARYGGNNLGNMGGAQRNGKSTTTTIPSNLPSTLEPDGVQAQPEAEPCACPDVTTPDD